MTNTTNTNNRDPNSPIQLPLGMIQLMPFVAGKIPAGWHTCNGGSFAIDTPQGQALAALDSELKANWKITQSGDLIFKPNLLTGGVVDGEGPFFRASSLVPGTITGDAIRNIIGNAYITADSQHASPATGIFRLAKPAMTTGSTGTHDDRVELSFDASRQVPTAAENRPVHVAMTPAIYLGV